MKNCPKCNAQFSDDTAFCQNCGTPLSAAAAPAVSSATVTCPVCKNQCAADENFCPKCGFRFRGAAPAPSASDPTSTVTLQQYYESYADPSLKKSISAMFWVFLVMSILNFLIAIALEAFPLDGLVLLGVAFWWKTSPGLPCAVLTVSYTVLSIFFSFLLYGTFTAWLIPVAAVLMFIYAQKLNNAYSSFIASQQ